MSRITDQRYDETINVLENSFLTAAAYDVATDGPNDVLLEISVKDYDQFSISLRQVTEGNFALAQAFNAQRKTYLVTIESPGDYIEEQRTEISDFAEFLKRLALWCDRVEKALVRNDSLQRQLSNLREKFEKELANHVGDAGVHFSADEKKAIFNKIDELSIKTREMLSKDAEKTGQIEKLQAMIAEMKAATALPKKLAIRVIAYKFAAFVVSATSSALLADGINYAIGLLNR